MLSTIIKRSLNRRFSLNTVGVVALILIVFSGIGIALRTWEIDTRLKKQLDNAISIAVPSLKSPLWSLDRNTLKGICEGIWQGEEVVYLRLFSSAETFYNNKKPLPGLESKNFSFFQASKKFITRSEDIFYKGDNVGTVEIAISKESSRDALLYSILSIIVIMSIIGTAISFTTISTTKRFLFGPLDKLKESATRIAEGDLDTKIDIESEDEIGVLAKDFEKMRTEVKKKVAELTEKKVELDKLNRSLEQQVKRRTKELEKAMNEAKKANQSKDRFLADVSHEVRTPLNSIIGFIELLQKSSLVAQQRQQLEIINSSAQDLLRMINDILDFSRLESGGPKICHNEFRLKNVLHSVKNSLEPTAQKKHILLSFNRKNGVPDYLIGDEFRLKQVLKNLVSNAIRYTDKGEVTVKIDCINIKRNKANLFFSVKDTGVGIAEEDMKKIFNPYERIIEDSSRGVGLGLTITRQLVELMGGKIKARSIVGKGSEFYFSLFFELQPEGEDSGSGIQESKSFDFSDLQGLKVLAAEDDPPSQLLIEGILTNAGMYVDIAGNGLEALRLVNASPYDVVLMDMKLPELSGYEVIKKIRKNKKLSDLPIIAVTAYAVVGDSKKCIDAGANQYISKPISSDQILIAIKKLTKKGENR